jgi:NarL family two-component system sensor histidine kinase LiaS
MNTVNNSLQQLRWKLTLSYTAVTMGTLLVVVLIISYLIFSTVLIPLNILSTVLTPKAWIQIAQEGISPPWFHVLSQDPVDTELLSKILHEGELRITTFDIFQIGDLEIQARTTGQGKIIVIDPDKNLLGTSSYDFIPKDKIGQPLDFSILPGLEEPIETALKGELNENKLFVTLEPNESFYFAVPYFTEGGQDVLAVGILLFENIPTENDLPENTLLLLGRSALLLLIGAGLIGTIFGAVTARGIAARLERVTQVTDAWSKGDFSDFITDPKRDEISQLAMKLNDMAEQLQQLLKRKQEMAVSEERNRLARDLHDSAKQEALAASFHLGTAITLYDRNPEEAKKHLAEADNLVNSVRRELTDLIHELRPPSMNGIRFDETLNEYLIEWAHQTGIKASLHVEGHSNLTLETKQAIYRIMQEALANIARHSDATDVAVSLEFLKQFVYFSVADNGVGFDLTQQFQGMGLDSMRERAEGLDGEFKLESTVDQGTKILVKFPTKKG